MSRYESPYRMPEWPRKRVEIGDRDGWRCQSGHSKRCLEKRGIGLTITPNQENTAVLGHVVDWRTQGGAWIADANLRIECKPCSQSEKNQRKREDGWRYCDTRVILVPAPPCGVGTPFIAERAGARDLIVDFDAIAQTLGSPSTWDHSDPIRQATNDQRNTLLRKVRAGDTGARTVWVLSTVPNCEETIPYHHETMEARPQLETALQLVADRPPMWTQMVVNWYEARPEHVWDWGV